MSAARDEQTVRELAELRSLASRIIERVEKLQAELTVRQDPANDANVKPSLDDFIALETRRRKRGARRRHG